MNGRPFLPEGLGLRRDPEQGRSQEKVNRILTAAVTLLREVGYVEATRSADLLSARAEVTKGTFYTYFANAEAVMENVSIRMLADACLIVEKLATETITSLEEAVDSLIDRFSKFYGDAAVRQIWLNHNFTHEAERLESRVSEYIIGVFVDDVLGRVDPAFTGWPRAARLTLAQMMDHLIQFAFRTDPAGDRALLAEAKRACHLYVASGGSD